MNLFFASQNKNKLLEIEPLLPKSFKLLNINDLGCFGDIPETAETLEDNALQKARFVSRKFAVDCIADDSGLEVEALNGAPGVHSARFAGPDRSSHDNMELLLKKLDGVVNRSARFRTVICLILAEKEYFFEGVVSGKIGFAKSGNDGFGYDPIFVPDGYSTTFAEMSLQDKNKISHRAVAIKKLIAFLNKVV